MSRLRKMLHNWTNGGKKGDGKYIATLLDVRLWTLVIVKAKANLIGIIPYLGNCAEYN